MSKFEITDKVGVYLLYLLKRLVLLKRVLLLCPKTKKSALRARPNWSKDLICEN